MRLLLLVVCCALATSSVAEGQSTAARIHAAPGPHEGIVFRRSRRSLFRVTAVNHGMAAGRVVTATRPTRQSGLQYGRDLAVPPRSKRVSSHPFYIPSGVARGRENLELETVVFRPAANDAQPQTHTTLIPLTKDRVVTGLLADPQDSDVRDLVSLARRSRNQSTRLTPIDSRNVPHSSEWLEGFDQLVLATGDLVHDPAAIVAVRRWLASGGRLWIMLDRVDPDRVASLMGDAFAIAQVDRVSIANLRLTDVRDIPQKAHSPPRHLDVPVDMVRVLVGDNNDVAFEVAGWPAAFWQQVSRGEVLFTTVGRAAWEDHQDQGPRADFGEPLKAIAYEFFQPRRSSADLPIAGVELAASLVGYAIISQRTVVGTLCACLGALLLVSVMSDRWVGRVHLPWIAVVAALGTSAALIFLGMASRAAVVSTATTIQLIDVSPDRGDIRIESVVGAYHPRPAESQIAGAGAVLRDDYPPLQGASGRIVWTDEDQWHLEEVELPAGLTIGRSSQHADLPDRPLVTATLTSTGIEGKLDGDALDGAADAILVSSQEPHLAVRFGSDGTFQSSATDALEVGQFVSSAVVGDAARGHQLFFRELLVDDSEAAQVSGLRLLFWTAPWKFRLALGKCEREVGEAMVAVPVPLARPAAGSTVAIPALLIPFTTVAGPDGTPVTSAYSTAEGKWVDTLFAASKITLRFQMPTELLPLNLQRAQLHVEISAPARQVSLVGWKQASPVELRTWSSPVGQRLRFPVTDPDVLHLDGRGGLMLNVNIGSHPREQQADIAKVGWRIKRVWLGVEQAVVP